MTKRRLGLAGLVLGWVAWGATGAPQAGGTGPLGDAKADVRGAASVVLREPSCRDMPVGLAAFADALRVELAGMGMPCCAASGRDGRPGDPVTIEVLVAPVRCGSLDTSVTIEVVEVPGGRQSRRELSLGDVTPSARPRALALVVAELVRARAVEPREPTPHSQPNQPGLLQPPIPSLPLPTRPTPTPTPTSTSTDTNTSTDTPAGPPPSRAPASRPRVSSGPLVRGVSADLELRHYTRASTTFAGARAALLIGSSYSRWTAEPAAGFLYARRRLELGDVTVECPTLGVTVGPWFALGPLVLQLAGRGEVGIAYVAGRSDRADVDAHEGSNVTFGLGLGARAEWPAGRAFRAALGMELGATLRGITADVTSRPVAAFQGAYGLATLGVRFSR